MQIFFWSVFSRICISSHLFVFSPNAGKYEPQKTQYLDKLHTVKANNVKCIKIKKYIK